MACGVVGNLQLVLNGPNPPGDREWTSYVRSPLSQSESLTIGLVHTLGGGPNPAQRQETTKFRRTEAPVPIRFAILTDVAFHRAFIRVVNLFEQVPFRAFSSGDLKGALAYLRSPIGESEVRRHFASLADVLGIVGYALPAGADNARSSFEI